MRRGHDSFNDGTREIIYNVFVSLLLDQSCVDVVSMVDRCVGFLGQRWMEERESGYLTSLCNDPRKFAVNSCLSL